MPRISQFYGIAIYMYHKDHAPPHFHAFYGDAEATVRIDTIQIEDGSLPRSARKLVLEWAATYQRELTENWGRAVASDTLLPVPPLD